MPLTEPHPDREDCGPLDSRVRNPPPEAAIEPRTGHRVADLVEIKAGHQVRLLKEWSLPRGGIHAVYPPGRHVSAKVRAFLKFYREYLQQP